MSTPGKQAIGHRGVGRNNAPIHEFLVGLAALASACTAIWLTRAPNGIALLWPASAIGAAIVIRFPSIRMGRAAIAVFVAVVLANVLAAHRPWAAALVFSAINLTETALMVATFRLLWKFPYPDISIGQAALMTALFGIAIPGVTTLLGGAALHGLYDSGWSEGSLQWWSSHVIGACLLGPPIILFSVKGLKRLLRPPFVVQNAVTVIACLVGCYAAIRFVRFPFVVIGLLLMIAAFRMGGFGAALMSLASGLVMTNLWILGIRPVGLDPGTANGASLIGFPVVALLATVMPPIAVGLGSDARRAAARALKVSERRFRESMEYSPVGMLISSLDGIWGYTNQALQQMLGYSAQEFRALPPGGPAKPQDWEESESRWKRLLSGEVRNYDVTRQFQHKDGHWIWTHVAVSVLRDEDGRPLHLISQIESLEARRCAEEKLAAERERLQITLGSINDAVITTDAASLVTYINAAAETLLRLEHRAVEGRRIDEVIHLMDPQTSKKAPNLIAQAALHGKVFRREQTCLLHRPDGTVCYVTDVVSPLFDSSGLISGFVLVFHDATFEVDRALDLERRALHDPLTGLSNRADFDQRLTTVFARARQLDRPAAVLAIDLDRFKAVNDAAGHAAGDALLCKVADACRTCVRASDTVARLGGDEFAIILDNCSQNRATHIGQQILRAIDSLRIDWAGSQYGVGASIGFAMAVPDLPDEKAWLKAADGACYAAKREGRGRLRSAAGTQNTEILTKQA